MGKRQKILNLDEDIIVALNKEDNMSRLVNNLLKQHYSEDLDEAALIKKKLAIEKNIAAEKLELEHIGKKLQEIKNNPAAKFTWRKE